MRKFCYELKCYLTALLEHPRGVFCGWCNRPNFFFDDCGWFMKDHRAACQKCHGPLTGDR